MDDFIAWLVILLLMGLAGWFLGIVGFFSARRALRETADLRRQIAAAPIAAPPPASVLEFIPAPEPELQPIAAPADVPYDEPVAAAPQPARRPDIEALLTTRWGVWLGPAALLHLTIVRAPTLRPTRVLGCLRRSCRSAPPPGTSIAPSCC
jgi:hypothetical protein